MGEVLTGTRASEDEDDCDLVMVEYRLWSGRALSSGVVLWMLAEVEGVRNLVNDGRHVDVERNGWKSSGILVAGRDERMIVLARLGGGRVMG